jgi:hypothetical protein
MKDAEMEDTAYLHEAVHGNYSEMHNNANWRSIAISLKRIADSMDTTDEHMCIPKSLGIIASVLAGDKI